MKLAVLKETADAERRVAATPETVKKFVALGAEVAVEAGAGLSASIADADYQAAGAALGARESALAGADAILGVQGPDPAALQGAKPGALVVAMLDPFRRRERVDAYAAAGLEALAMEFMPRITRAQSMDDGTQILDCRFDVLHIGTIQQVKKVSAALSQHVWD